MSSADDAETRDRYNEWRKKHGLPVEKPKQKPKPKKKR